MLFRSTGLLATEQQRIRSILPASAGVEDSSGLSSAVPKWFTVGVKAGSTDRPADRAATLRLLLAAACDPWIEMGSALLRHMIASLKPPAGTHKRRRHWLVSPVGSRAIRSIPRPSPRSHRRAQQRRWSQPNAPISQRREQPQIAGIQRQRTGCAMGCELKPQLRNSTPGHQAQQVPSCALLLEVRIQDPGGGLRVWLCRVAPCPGSQL